jgi:hypothetical protein
MEPFQAIRIPPEAPSEGTKAYLLNRLGAIFRIAEESKWSFLVSWIQKIAQLHFNFGSDSITLVSRIEAPNIPIKDIPATNIVIVHWKQTGIDRFGRDNRSKP